MIPKTHTVVPFLIAMLVAVAGMPTNVFQICRRSVGTLEVEPWLVRTSATLTHAIDASTAWMKFLLGLRGPAVCTAAVLLALMAADLSAAHLTTVTVLMAIPPVAVTVMSLDQLRAEREQLVRANDGLKPANGVFASDEARATFDSNTARLVEIDARIKELEKTPANPVTPVNEEASRAAGATAERARITGITDAVRLAKLPAGDAADMIGRGVSLDAARAEIFTKLAAQSQADAPAGQVRVNGDAERDKWIRGVTNWLLMRSDKAAMVAKAEGVELRTMDPGEFRGLSLLDLARAALVRHGQSVSGLDKMEIAGRAMAYRSNYQTTSDFATVLENAMHKLLRAAYVIQQDTWSKVCGTATVNDFRAHNWYRMGNLTQFDSLNEQGEFVNKSIPDAEKATMTAGTKGNIIAISRQVVVNDDVGFVMRLTEMLGRAGKLTIEKAFYTSIGLNGGLGPTQTDAQPLFHANRNNVNTSATAITVAGIQADVAIMRRQQDPGNQEYIDLLPNVLLCAVEKDGDAKTINDAQFDPADSKFQKPNTVRGMFSAVVSTPRLSGNRRYIFADPTVNPIWVVSFLEGQREPVLETQNGWRVDGVEMKGRLDFGLDVVDYRGAVTNAGA